MKQLVIPLDEEHCGDLHRSGIHRNTFLSRAGMAHKTQHAGGDSRLSGDERQAQDGPHGESPVPHLRGGIDRTSTQKVIENRAPIFNHVVGQVGIARPSGGKIQERRRCGTLAPTITMNWPINGHAEGPTGSERSSESRNVALVLVATGAVANQYQRV